MFSSQRKRQQGTGHLINTNKLLAVWESMYRMWNSTTVYLKRTFSLMFHNVSFNSYKSDYTVNIHPVFTWLKLSNFFRTQDCMNLCCKSDRSLACLMRMWMGTHGRETGRTVSHIFAFKSTNKQVRQMASIFSKSRAGHFSSLSCHYFEYCICVLFLPHVFGALCSPTVQF